MTPGKVEKLSTSDKAHLDQETTSMRSKTLKGGATLKGRKAT